MKVEVRQMEDLKREIHIEVPAETVSRKIDDKLKEIQAKTELKGFRRGKAPITLIRQMFEDQVKGDVAEEVIKATYPDAVRQHDLKVASYPTVTELKFTDEGGMNYVAAVEVFPEITSVVYDGLTVINPEVEVADDEVNSVIEELRKRNATVTVVHREVGTTDLVVVDIEKLEDTKNVLGQDRFENSSVDLRNPMTVKEFKEHLPGKKVGDQVEIAVSYPEDYPDVQFAGAKLQYRVTVKEVKEQVYPEVNDAFAKRTEQAETLLELRLKIRQRLEMQKKDEIRREQKNQLIGQLTQKNMVPLPQGMVDEYVDNVIEDFKKQYKDVDEEEIRRSYRPIGENMLRWNMLMHRLAEQEKIEVLASDTDKLIARFADNYNITPEQAKEALGRSSKVADLRDSILEDKVVDFLRDKATVQPAGKI